MKFKELVEKSKCFCIDHGQEIKDGVVKVATVAGAIGVYSTTIEQLAEGVTNNCDSTFQYVSKDPDYVKEKLGIEDDKINFITFIQKK